MGPFSTTDRDNTFLMVIGDYFSKFAVSVPLPNTTARTVSQALVDNWLSYFGVPLEIHTDKGTHFESVLFKETCKLLGIEKARATTMRPQSDGFVETLNQTICNILNCDIYENPISWDELVRSYTFSYNSSIQESTWQTPPSMLFGREYTLPIDLISPLEDLKQKSEISSSGYVLNLQSTLQEKENEFKRGSLVYYHYPIKKSNVGKECYYQWKGPYVVVDKISDRIFRIQENAKSEPIVVNHDKLKIAHSRNKTDLSWCQKLKSQKSKTYRSSRS